MNINGLVFTLLLGGILLAIISVLIDRVNFPQRPFRPKQLHPSSHGPGRDRTGSHIRDVYVDSVDPAKTEAASTATTNAANTDAN